MTKTSDDEGRRRRIKLPHPDAAEFDAALASHRDALIAEWKRDRDNGTTTNHQLARYGVLKLNRLGHK